MSFTEICIYQVKPQKVEEFEALMYVEIIEPVEARNILKEKAKRISAMY